MISRQGLVIVVVALTYCIFYISKTAGADGLLYFQFPIPSAQVETDLEEGDLYLKDEEYRDQDSQDLDLDNNSAQDNGEEDNFNEDNFVIDNSTAIDDSKLPNFYRDRYSTYDCHERYSAAGSHPKFMVLGVHKGGSTAMYNYLIKHGRIRPAVCKEIHFFDDEERFRRGRGFYLRHFPDVSKYQGHVITGEGSPAYIRFPLVVTRVKSMFPDVKFILTLREPSTRFESHWVGAKDNHNGPMGRMSCEEAWNASLARLEGCYANEEDEEVCDRRMHENAIVRGIYTFQIHQWMKAFPPEQFFIVQAEAVFKDPPRMMQKVAKFLNIRPYTDEELESLHNAKEGSQHMSEAIAQRCEPIKTRMDEFYAAHNRELKNLLSKYFPETLEDWVDGWAGL